MTYHNAVKYILNSPQKNGAADSFDRIRLLCKRLGSPERNLRYIRFAGSNGKTVCQTMLESILHHSGMKVGSLLMPVSADPRSNIRVSTSALSMDDTVRYVSIISAEVTKLKDEIEALANDSEQIDNNNASDIPQTVVSKKVSVIPTKNEMIFMISLLAFRDAGCDICLIECEHDAADPTKMLTPPHAAIICGAIPSENAKETHKIRSYLQSGISEVVSAPQDGETYKIISSACARINCRLSVPTRSMLEISRMTLGGSEFIYRGNKYSIGLCGRFQVHNAITVIEAVRMLNRAGAKITPDDVRLGLAAASIKAKFETLSVLPTIIADSTHKTEAVGAMCDTLADFKEQTGSELKLCIPNDQPLISTYLEKLCERGYSVNEIIIPVKDKNTPIAVLEGDINIKITQPIGAKATAKYIISASREGGFVLMTAPIAQASELRAEILKILQF